MTWSCQLEMAIRNRFRKLNHLRRVLHCTTKETLNCTLLKTYMFSVVFCASHVWNTGLKHPQRLEKLQRSCWKWITCRLVLGTKEYVESLIRNRLLSASHFIVSNNIILLNKILVGWHSMNASDYWSTIFDCPKIRSSSNLFYWSQKNISEAFWRLLL